MAPKDKNLLYLFKATFLDWEHIAKVSMRISEPAAIQIVKHIYQTQKPSFAKDAALSIIRNNNH